jgi:hypothetical protein
VSRRPPKGYPFLDPTWMPDGSARVGVVRYDGEPEVWAREVLEIIRYLGFDDDQAAAVQPPELRYYRMNVCNDGEYGWMLGGPRDTPGRGWWRGALVVVPKEHY